MKKDIFIQHRTTSNLEMLSVNGPAEPYVEDGILSNRQHGSILIPLKKSHLNRLEMLEILLTDSSNHNFMTILLLILFIHAMPYLLIRTGSVRFWLVVLGLNGPLIQYFSLFRAVSQREGERKEKRETRREKKMSKQPPSAHTASTVGPCPTIIQISRTPGHWKFTQHHRTTRPPPVQFEMRS